MLGGHSDVCSCFFTEWGLPSQCVNLVYRIGCKISLLSRHGQCLTCYKLVIFSINEDVGILDNELSVSSAPFKD